MGHGAAIRLAERGYTVFAGCLRPNGDGAKVLQQKTVTIHVVPLDVTKDTSVCTAVATIKEKLPENGLWAVINNAGIVKYGHIELARMEMLKEIAGVNYFGVVRVTKAFLQLIRKTKGRIINVTSVKGRVAFAKELAYVSSKWATEAFSDVLRREMYMFGVKVIVIEPGNFSAGTSLVKGDNLKLAEADLNEAWDDASPEIKEAYGRACVDNLLDAVRGAGETGSTSLAKIVNAMQDAVENENPKYLYLVHGVWPIDKDCILARLHELLPECVMDFILRRR